MKKWRVVARVALAFVIVGIFFAPGSPLGPSDASALPPPVVAPELPVALVPALASSVGVIIYKVRSFFGL